MQNKVELNSTEKQDRDYKARYNRLFPSRLSSSNFLTLYSLYLLDKNGSVYGKEILDHITNTLGSGVWNPSHGTLYPLLQNMEDKEYIKSSGLLDKYSKKYYTITDEGKKVLYDQLRDSKPIIIESYKFFKNMVKDLYGEDEVNE